MHPKPNGITLGLLMLALLVWGLLLPLTVAVQLTAP
jgi:hypothetical protein